MTDQITPPAPEQSPCACWPGRLCNRSAECSAEAMVRATHAPAAADHATVEQWESALTAVMPADLKCWHENSRREWPEVAVWVIEGLRQSRDEAWATVERLTATAPAPATGKPGLQVEQAQAVPVGAEPVSLDAAVRLGLEYAREALATHDQQFANHPATALERGSIVADIATMEASLASPVAGPSFSSCSAGGCPDKRGCDAAQHCLYTAPQAPQQAECPECIEQARLLGAGGERELALMAEVEQLKCICTSIHDGLLRGADDRELLDLAAQAWDGGPAPQQAELTDEQIYAVDRQVMEGAQTGGYILALCRAVIAEDRALRTPGMEQRKALTDEQLGDGWDQEGYPCSPFTAWCKGVRWAERTHGIVSDVQVTGMQGDKP